MLDLLVNRQEWGRWRMIPSNILTVITSFPPLNSPLTLPPALCKPKRKVASQGWIKPEAKLKLNVANVKATVLDTADKHDKNVTGINKKLLI